MARTKFFRVATEGATVDGRKIERKHLEQMAATYDPVTYTARINAEHVRGVAPDGPFQTYGSVAALKTEEFKMNLGGKEVTRLGLYASFEVNDKAKSLIGADQKIFTSIEIRPDFAETGKAYLDGIAFTDSPASLATEALKFSKRDDSRKDNLFAIEDTGFTLEFTEDISGGADLVIPASWFKNLFSGFVGGQGQTQTRTEPETQPLPPKKTNEGDAAQFTAMAQAMEQGFAKMSESIAASFAKQDARIGKVTQDLAALQTDLEKTPDRRNHSARPIATGGGDRILADC